MTELVIFGGTSEGRQLTEALCNMPLQIHVCVATKYGATLLPVCDNVHIHVGRMNQEEIVHFLSTVHAGCCVDATHPYAAEVTCNARGACRQLGITYVRLLRREERFSKTDSSSGSKVIYRDSIKDAVDFLKGTTGNIFITTGSKELSLFTDISDYQNRCFARVLPTAKVVEACSALGFEGKNLIGMQGPFDEELNYCLLQKTHAKWLVTKSSGKEGGFLEKCDAAVRAGVHLVIIGRPQENMKQAMDLKEVLVFLRNQFGLDPKGREDAAGRRILYLIGMGPGSGSLMTMEAKNALAESDVIIGAHRMLEICKEYAGKPFFQSYQKEEILSFLMEHEQYQRAALVYSGDIGFYSGAAGMRELIAHTGASFEIVPICGISSPVCFLDKLGKPWEDVHLVSCHGQSVNLLPIIRISHRVCALSGSRETVADICLQLVAAGLGDIAVTVGERLTYEDEKIVTGKAKEFCGAEFDPLSVALFENPYPAGKKAGFGIPDDMFIRGKVPMTKEEIRILTLAKLQLCPDSILYDIGAGTGSVSVEAALQLTGGRVYAIERKPEAVRLLYENRKKFHVGNLTVVQGEAPDCLKGLELPTHVFIGGSGGRLTDILNALFQIKSSLRIVINAVTLETMTQLQQFLLADPAACADVIQVQIARSKRTGHYHRMDSENPVYLYILEKRV